MGKKALNPRDWEEYDDDNDLLYSYLKKKGKHKIAKADDKDKGLRRGPERATRS